MSINFSDKPEINVVNVGDEITSDQLAAITGSSAPSASNVFATIADVGGGGGGGSGYLPLSGGTMTGDIVFGTAGQYVGEGNFDTSMGGANGLSLVCSVGYEFNWQAGYLNTTEQNSTTRRPLYLDSAAGTTLRCWNSAADSGTEISHQSFYSSYANGYIEVNNNWPDGFKHSWTGSTIQVNALFGIQFSDGSSMNTAPTGMPPAPNQPGLSSFYVYDQNQYLWVSSLDLVTATNLTIVSGINSNNQISVTNDNIGDGSGVCEIVLGDANLGYITRITAQGIKFTDNTLQTSAPVYSAGTVLSGGSGSTLHEGSYPDEIRIVINGITYAMPARAI